MDSNLRQMLKLVCSTFTLLGITSTIGAITHGNDPYKSIVMGAWGLGFLIILNLNDKEQ